MQSPPIGTPVVWYPTGNPNEKPLPAFVVDHGIPGLLTVIVIRPGRIQRVLGVKHISDPSLTVTPMSERAYSGAWDYHPWIRPQDERMKRKDADKERVGQP